MRQTKQGNQYDQGCKIHIGVDAEDGLIHGIELTAANVHEITNAHKLIRDTDEAVFGDAGYTGLMKRAEMQHRSDLINLIALRPGERRRLDKSTEYGKITEAYEKKKASIRAKLEHPFHLIKNVSRKIPFKKTRYRGLAKNRAVRYVLCGIANLMRAGKRLLHAG